jgi:basic amino acid/polyamine antiporter, APA family
VLGGLGTGIAWLVVVLQEPVTRWVGLGWLALGFVSYAVYRGRVLRIPLRETVRAPQVVLLSAATIEYRTIVVPVVRSPETEEALVAAARLAAERRANIVAVTVIEVPLALSLDAELTEEEAAADELLDEARAFLEAYGVRVLTRILRARRAGPAIVEEAVRRNAELVVVGAPRRRIRRRGALFGTTVDQILRASPIRVLVIAGEEAA